MAHGLDLVGERWALLVVRELLLGPKRFTDLRSGLPGISANILTQRLRELDDAGIIRHDRLPPPASHQIYELTPYGLELETVIDSLGRWALRSPTLTMDRPRSKDSQLLLLRLLFAPATTGGFHATIGLCLAGEPFQLTIADERITLTRGLPSGTPDATVETPHTQALHMLLRGRRSVDELVEAGELRVSGDRAVIARLPEFFRYPRNVTPPA
ncbi:winged helix-turn-helix transcriptional regulator [Kibdelosporangium lantanae]